MYRFIAFGISLPRDIVEKIDLERGDIPRSRYVLRILEKSYSIDRKMEPGYRTGKGTKARLISDFEACHQASLGVHSK